MSDDEYEDIWDKYGDVYIPGEGLVEGYLGAEYDDVDSLYSDEEEALKDLYGMDPDVERALRAHYGVQFRGEKLDELDGMGDDVELSTLDEKDLPEPPANSKWKIASCLQDAIEKEKKQGGKISYFSSGLERRKGWEDSSLIVTVDDATFHEICELKAAGNKLFADHSFAEAIQLYNEALVKFPDGLVMPATQLDEKVKILSNKAECFLRLKQNMEAGMAAYKAICLDDSHEKSRLRRAKACYRLVFKKMEVINPAFSFPVEDDLHYIIDGNGPGKEEAQTLLDAIHDKLSGEPMNEVSRQMSLLIGRA